MATPQGKPEHESFSVHPDLFPLAGAQFVCTRLAIRAVI